MCSKLLSTLQESNMGFVWDFQQHMVVFREA